MAPVTTIAGFSLVNRWLLYTGVMLAPAQFASGINNNCPSNIGFLAFNWYSQILWYRAVKNQQLHALSMVLPNFTLAYTVSYLGGISSGNLFNAIVLSFGTVGVMLVNHVAAWKSWAVNMPMGYGEYEFFFFGWRTLSEGWHKMFLAWQIFDSILILPALIGVVFGAIYIRKIDEDKVAWWYRYPMIPLGAVLMLLFFWPLIMWTELIMARNHIESATDWIQVWLFVAQVGTMVMPDCGLFKRRS